MTRTPTTARPVAKYAMIDKDDKIRFFHTFAKQVFVKDPIDKQSVFSESSRTLLFDWCKENCKGCFWIGLGFGQFELEADATLFLLRWS